MNEADFNLNDPCLLASRDLDGDLTSEERQQLGDALDASQSLRADADAMRKVSEFVRRWAVAPGEIDWDAHARLIHARCLADDDAHDRPELDDLLKRWAQGDGAHDDEQFTSGVMQRIGGDSVRSRNQTRRQWVFRLAVPLAAAAVLTFALIGGSWMNRDMGSPEIAPVLLTDSSLGATKAPTCIVRFARESVSAEPEPSVADAHRPSGISFTTFGLATVGVVAMPPVP